MLYVELVMNNIKRILLASLCPFLMAQYEMSYGLGILGVSAVCEKQSATHPSLNYKVALNSGFPNGIGPNTPPTFGASMVARYYNSETSCGFFGPFVLVAVSAEDNLFVEAGIEMGYEIQMRNGNAVQLQLLGTSPLSIAYKVRFDSEL